MIQAVPFGDRGTAGISLLAGTQSGQLSRGLSAGTHSPQASHSMTVFFRNVISLIWKETTATLSQGRDLDPRIPSASKTPWLGLLGSHPAAPAPKFGDSLGDGVVHPLEFIPWMNSAVPTG